MVPDNLHDLFAASAGVAGALVGLLFVAISVAHDRLEEDSAQLHRVGAQAALTSFTNALTVSLFALIPGKKLGATTLSVSILGLLFVLGSLLSLWRAHRKGALAAGVRDALFLVSLAVTFVIQLRAGIALQSHPTHTGNAETIAITVVVCFLIGITRSWVLIGGPSVGFTSEVTKLVRERPSASGSEPAPEPEPDPTPADPERERN
jgi:hypothetical protein